MKIVIILESRVAEPYAPSIMWGRNIIAKMPNPKPETVCMMPPNRAIRATDSILNVSPMSEILSQTNIFLSRFQKRILGILRLLLNYKGQKVGKSSSYHCSLDSDGDKLSASESKL